MYCNAQSTNNQHIITSTNQHIILLVNHFIAILRGINVSGQKLIKMEELRKALEEGGFSKVRTYIQSGNIAFETDETDGSVLEIRLSKIILDRFGFEVPVIVLKKEEVENVFSNNPFLVERQEDISFLHITFLASKPDVELVEKIKSLAFPPDEFILSGKAVYLFCPKGYGNTKLNNQFFETKLKVKATTRNWKTVGQLIDL